MTGMIPRNPMTVWWGLPWLITLPSHDNLLNLLCLYKLMIDQGESAKWTVEGMNRIMKTYTHTNPKWINKSVRTHWCYERYLGSVSLILWYMSIKIFEHDHLNILCFIFSFSSSLQATILIALCPTLYHHADLMLPSLQVRNDPLVRKVPFPALWSNQTLYTTSMTRKKRRALNLCVYEWICGGHS